METQPVEVWIYCHHVGATFEEAVRRGLAEHQIRIRTLQSESPRGCAVLLFLALDRNLLKWLRRVSRTGGQRILALTAQGENLRRGDAVWRLLKAGASDVLAWEEIAQPAEAVAARLRRWLAADELMDSPQIRTSAVGRSRAWRDVLRSVVEVSRFTDVSVLLLGETGTGKDLMARLVHELDPRPNKEDMVVLDCTTVVPELSGSEFFGHERGAFTGAESARDGAFALAHRGTLFLDEVAELPLSLQAQLLRVVQEGTYKRVGGNTWRHTRFRLVSATNKDLEEEVRQGRFRRDLYYRIANWSCELPPLRNRREDIVPLARHFLRELREDPPALDDSVVSLLVERPYPGNVRELKQLVNTLLCQHPGCGPITVGQVPPEERPSKKGTNGEEGGAWERCIQGLVSRGLGLKEIGRRAEETAIRIATELEDGNLQRAARRLGVTDRTLQIRRRNDLHKVNPGDPRGAAP